MLKTAPFLYDPVRKQERLIGASPSPAFIAALRAKGVDPVSVGKCIVATWEPNETAVLEAIRELGLELQIIFNKGAVMVLPPGVSKAAGLKAALDDLGLSPHNVVAVGDAENDLSFLDICGCSAAVANALPSVKQCVDLVLQEGAAPGLSSSSIKFLRARRNTHPVIGAPFALALIGTTRTCGSTRTRAAC